MYDVRKRAWATRRAKYGPRGHNSPYSRPRVVACEDCLRMTHLIVKLYAEGVLSEGQASKATGLPRVDLRRMADTL